MGSQNNTPIWSEVRLSLYHTSIRYPARVEERKASEKDAKKVKKKNKPRERDSAIKKRGIEGNTMMREQIETAQANWGWGGRLPYLNYKRRPRRSPPPSTHKKNKKRLPRKARITESDKPVRFRGGSPAAIENPCSPQRNYQWEILSSACRTLIWPGSIKMVGLLWINSR